MTRIFKLFLLDALLKLCMLRLIHAFQKRNIFITLMIFFKKPSSFCIAINSYYFLFFCSYFEDPNTRPVAMVSRRKILSRSRDDLNLEDSNSFRPDRAGAAAEEEDVWYAKEKLYKVSVSKKRNIFNFIRSFVLEKVIT